MGLALRLYEQLSEATDERVRIRLIADAIGEFEDRWPHTSEILRGSDLRESELRLQKEIEGVWPSPRSGAGRMAETCSAADAALVVKPPARLRSQGFQPRNIRPGWPDYAPLAIRWPEQ